MRVSYLQTWDPMSPIMSNSHPITESVGFPISDVAFCCMACHKARKYTVLEIYRLGNIPSPISISSSLDDKPQMVATTIFQLNELRQKREKIIRCVDEELGSNTGADLGFFYVGQNFRM